MELNITTAVDAQQRGVVSPTGAVDLASRDDLLNAGLVVLNNAELKGLVLDLAGVDFIDSSGIGVIVELAGDAADLERGFALARPSERVVRILDVTGLRDTWPIEDATA